MTLEGTQLPQDNTLYYIDAKTGEPTPLETSELAKESEVVIVGIPGAFTPPCTEKHIPGYIKLLPKFKEKNVKVIIVNKDNVFVQKAWAKQAFGIEGEAKQKEIIFTSDPDLKFIRALKQWTTEVEALGDTSSRFAIVVKNGKITYFGKEKAVGDVDVSSAEEVLRNL